LTKNLIGIPLISHPYYPCFRCIKEAVVKTIRYLLIYLFIIGVELLSLQIKSNPKIKGALVNDTESLISQYADVNSALSHREDEYFHP
jgi:hypothetical protein